MVSKQLQKILTIYILLKKIRTNQVTIYNTAPHHKTPSVLIIDSVPMRIDIRPVIAIMPI